MDLIIEKLNEVKLNVTTNDGEYVMTFKADQSCADKPTIQFCQDDNYKKMSINMPFDGMTLCKAELR